MKKNSPLLIKCAVGLIILFGVLLILWTNENSVRTVVDDDIENISKLSSSIIYAEIDNSLTKPIFVGQTMANDLFLKNWLLAEPSTGGDTAQSDIIQQFLSDYSKKYGYSSVFVVSAGSNVYYGQDGINKVVSTEDAHDVWYYDFIKSGATYDLDVDLDEAHSNQLTVFVNCRIVDGEGNLLGVAGVGIQMSHLQKMLYDYESEYGLEAFLISSDGLVQVDSHDDNIEVVNFFQRSEIQPLENQILGERSTMKIFWYPLDGAEHCLITQYVENLDWYLVVEKDTTDTQQMFAAQIRRSLLLIAVIIVLVLLLVSFILGKYKKMLLHAASVDSVTNLPNNKMFMDLYQENVKRPAYRQGALFLFDIDNFKEINDQYGHISGNSALLRVSQVAQEVIGTRGVVARWGGDEFVGALYGTPAETQEIITHLVEAIAAIHIEDCKQITVSLGATRLDENASLDDLLQEADSTMYRAKALGKNQAAFHDA